MSALGLFDAPALVRFHGVQARQEPTTALLHGGVHDTTGALRFLLIPSGDGVAAGQGRNIRGASLHGVIERLRHRIAFQNAQTKVYGYRWFVPLGAMFDDFQDRFAVTLFP
jgi:hypothetical protein